MSSFERWSPSELTCLTSTGRFLSAEISASIIDISGRSCMIALVRDISERKRAEEALRRVNERMREDLEAAASVQESLLPAASSNEVQRTEIVIEGLAVVGGFSAVAAF